LNPAHRQTVGNLLAYEELRFFDHGFCVLSRGSVGIELNCEYTTFNLEKQI